MILNKNKSIGRVLFIVEGAKTEFSLLKHIFNNILEYEYIEKRRNRANFYISPTISTSKIAVINAEQSNISSINDENHFLDYIFESLISDYNFPVDKAAIYYVFDRDPKSNLDVNIIKNLLNKLKNPYLNESGERGGLLLLSYPSIEAYNISNFINDTYTLKFSIGKDVKAYIIQNSSIIQNNKITETTIIKAANEMFKYINSIDSEFDIDNFSKVNKKIFESQEKEYLKHKSYNLVSLLSIALIDLGIIE